MYERAADTSRLREGAEKLSRYLHTALNAKESIAGLCAHLGQPAKAKALYIRC